MCWDGRLWCVLSHSPSIGFAFEKRLCGYEDKQGRVDFEQGSDKFSPSEQLPAC